MVNIKFLAMVILAGFVGVSTVVFSSYSGADPWQTIWWFAGINAVGMVQGIVLKS